MTPENGSWLAQVVTYVNGIVIDGLIVLNVEGSGNRRHESAVLEIRQQVRIEANNNQGCRRRISIAILASMNRIR